MWYSFAIKSDFSHELHIVYIKHIILNASDTFALYLQLDLVELEF